jgi:flagellar hook-length control protein FliK
MSDPTRPAVDATPKGVEAIAAKAAALAADETGDARKDDQPTTGDPQPTLVGAPAHHDGVERVTERAATTTVSHAVALSAVAETVATHAHAGTSRFAIKLDPAELGSIDVRVEVKSTGEVRAHLVVERADTLDMMLRDQKSLERSLAQSGLDVGSSGLQFSLKDQGSGNGSTSRDDLPRAVAATETDEPIPVSLDLAAQAYRPRRPGGLDLRI